MAEQRPDQAPPPGGAQRPGPDDVVDRSLGDIVGEVTDSTQRLVRDEIALAKAEVTEKVKSLGRGAAVIAAAGVFVLIAFTMFMHAFAWLINDLLNFESIWPGFAIEGALWILLAIVAGLYARRAFKKGSPPKPEMAIHEAELAVAELKATGTDQPTGTALETRR